MMKSRMRLSTQRGSMLLEAFIAILLFSTGILGMMGLQAVSLKNSADARHRVEAAYLANQIIGQMWAGNTSAATIGTFAHQTSGAACNFSGGASGNAAVAAWLGTDVTPAPAGSVLGTLPGATTARQQIFIGANNVVTVTLCWQSPGDSAPRSYVGIAQING
jgi:type IV pilus assembly protein PilV